MKASSVAFARPETLPDVCRVGTGGGVGGISSQERRGGGGAGGLGAFRTCRGNGGSGGAGVFSDATCIFARAITASQSPSAAATAGDGRKRAAATCSDTLPRLNLGKSMLSSRQEPRFSLFVGRRDQLFATAHAIRSTAVDYGSVRHFNREPGSAAQTGKTSGLVAASSRTCDSRT